MMHRSTVAPRLPAALLTLAMIFICFGVAAGSPPEDGANGLTTVILVRHAEKTDDSRDPELSEEGRRRAAHLAEMLEHVGVDGLYASQFKRTRSTLLPLAEAKQLEVQVAEVKSPLPEYASAFVAQLMEWHAGGTVVVAGHSNTVPMLVQALGVGSAPEIGDSSYGDLFIVTVDAGGAAHLLHLSY